MAEWFKAAVLKTAVRVTPHRGFESPSLRWSDYLMMTIRAKGQNGQASDKVILQAPSFGLTTVGQRHEADPLYDVSTKRGI